MRGEHPRGLPDGHSRGGSSPHARGAPEARDLNALHSGIIPACAGSTDAVPRAAAVHRDHPRMRGEHSLALSSIGMRPGSSPHARGALRGHARSAAHDGIIPACAGSTRRRSPRRSTSRDHPRMRGEHCLTPPARRLVLGSSPHARGAQIVGVVHPIAAGIIPACAGSTRSSHSKSISARDHPRMRGEHYP